MIGCFLLLSMAFLLLRNAYGSRPWFRWGTAVVWGIWFAAALWTTILRRTPGIVYTPEWIPFHSLRELQATEQREILRTNFMNAALFYPAGLLAAELLPKRWCGSRCGGGCFLKEALI